MSLTQELSESNRMYPEFCHEYEIRRYIRKKLMSRGGVFIDVGANVGVYTIDLADMFDKVYAVEPWYAGQLRLNIKDYGVENVVVIEAAAWDFNGKVIMGISRRDNGVEVPKVGIKGRIVDAVRLDDVISEPFRFLKVDVEGNAIHVLRGMERLISMSGGLAQIEVHNHGESHGTYIFMNERGWRLVDTLNEYSSGDKYHAHKVYAK